jgi:periplasmic divalent cation tolerance protein
MPSGGAEIATVYAVFANADEAGRIGQAAIESGHAACVNILAPCVSIYRWDGKVEHAAEVPALFKVPAERASALIAFITERHSYVVPAIALWPITEAPEAYARWVRGETK